MPKRVSISVSPECGEKLRTMQERLERKVGFEPSLAQIVEFLVNNYFETRRDMMNDSQHVQQPK
jgi:hypothetical protein